MKTNFYTFDQNNSGGFSKFNKYDGITEYVIVEANNENHANEIAESIGIYFDGEGDCKCCGNRWEKAGAWNARDYPEVYGDRVDDEQSDSILKGNNAICVHYLNGNKEWF